MKTLAYCLLSLLISSLSWSQELKLIGSAKLEYSIFKIDIYNIRYYQGTDGSEELQLEYLRDIKKEHSVEGWKVGLAPLIKLKPHFKDKVEWILKHTSDLKQNDLLKLTKSQNGVIWSKNGVEVARIQDQDISMMIHYPWLGDQPISTELKRDLTGK